MKVVITETIEFEVEADSVEDGVEAWLTEGESAKGYAFLAVTERTAEEKEVK